MDSGFQMMMEYIIEDDKAVADAILQIDLNAMRCLRKIVYTARFCSQKRNVSDVDNGIERVFM